MIASQQVGPLAADVTTRVSTLLRHLWDHRQTPGYAVRDLPLPTCSTANRRIQCVKQIPVQITAELRLPVQKTRLQSWSDATANVMRNGRITTLAEIPSG